MSVRKSDIAVIGGGPAGSKAASLLSGRDVCVVEEHNVSGTPMQCTGLVSDEVLRLSSVKTDVLNSLYGMNIRFPDGSEVTMRSKERKAVLIDRSGFDRRMAEKAQDLGVEYHYGTKYLDHAVHDGTVSVRTTGGTIDAKLLIGADGHSSAVSRSIGNMPKEYVRGIQADVKYASDDQGMIDILVGSEYAPGFFAWIIPYEDKVRVGVCSSFSAPPPSEYLGNVMKRMGMQNARIIEKHSGKIPLGGVRATYGDSVMLIGDAACQVKPVSGGGLYPALVSSFCLKKTAEEAFECGDMSAAFLRTYEKRWKRLIGRELRNGYALRRVFRRMDDRALNDISEALRTDGIGEVLNGMNMDGPSDLATQLMKDVPAMSRIVPAVLKAMVRR